MDALMIVHQLQRLAVEPRPASAVRAKIPRMAVGICYFLEHPDAGVQHQAAGALRLMLQQHHQLLLQSPELKELRAALQQHANSKDVVVSECCTASLALLQQHEQQQGEQQQQQEQQQEPQQQQPGGHTAEETLESLDLFSVVLGLRGLLSCASNRCFLIAKPQPDEQQHQQQRQRMLELLQRDLQLRLVRVWGVSSATVTLNTASLLKQAADIEPSAPAAGAAAAAAQKPQQGEEGDGVAVVIIRLSRRSQRLQQQLRELRAATGPLTLLLSSELVQKAQRPAGDRPTPEASSTDCSSSANGVSEQGPETAKEEGQKQQVQERGYLDEELRENWGGEVREDGAAPNNPNSSNGGFSFFSSNSALFGKSVMHILVSCMKLSHQVLLIVVYLWYKCQYSMAADGGVGRLEGGWPSEKRRVTAEAVYSACCEESIIRCNG
ncbi:hypothetical protein ACSSS7_001730 [Eimeria intestinalis]